MQKVIAVDFDDCICTNNWPDVGEPDWDIINQLKAEQRENDAALILWTCREGIPLQNAVEACKRWGLEFDAVNENVAERIKLWGRDSRKVSADEYWDDLAVAKIHKNKHKKGDI